jgi:phosphoglycolate phosphatase-like HAD superfamily hydrolase
VHHANPDDLNEPRAPVALFLDDGGVLDDNGLRGAEWPRLIGEFMPARLGGTADRWASANRAVSSRVWASLQQRLPEFISHREFQRTYATDWMNAMCGYLGITPPRDDDIVTLYAELATYIGQRATSAIAGAADAVRSLHRAGYILYMASGTPSWELRSIVENMGIAATLTGLYGPDLVDHVKYGAAFDERVFLYAGIAPGQVLVIESDRECCHWASEAGARAVWIDPRGRGDASTLESLAQVLV